MKIFGSGYRSEDRRLWEWNDPMLVSESFYCIAVVMAFGHLLYFCQVTYFINSIGYKVCQFPFANEAPRNGFMCV